MNVPLIKIEKKVQGKIEQAKVIVSLFTKLMDIRLSDSETTVIAYFMVYGSSENTKELILKSKVLAGNDSLNNALSKLRKIGLLKKNRKQDILVSSLDIKIEPLMGVFIKIDNK